MRKQLEIGSPWIFRGRRKQWLFAALTLIVPLTSTVGHAQADLRLDLPAEEWSAKEFYEAQWRRGIVTRQRVAFGEFATSKVSRSWTTGFSLQVSVRVGPAMVYWKDYERRKQSLRFLIDSGEGKQAEVFGLTKFRAEHFDGIGKNSAEAFLLDLIGARLQSEHNYFVSIYLGGDEKPWNMVFDSRAAQMERKTYATFLARGPGEAYRIVPVYRLQSRRGVASIPFGALGFEFRDMADDRPRAAFSFLDDGQVYFNEGVTGDERLLLAAATAALLVHEEIE